MKILLVHAAYKQYGGEDVVFSAERKLLEERHHDVAVYHRSNREMDTLSGPKAAKETIWSERSKADVAALIESFRPDLIHVHNTFQIISPSIYYAAAARNIPVVQTLHNFRLVCPQAMLIRDEKVCIACVGRLPWRAVVYRCYRDSVSASAVSMLMLGVHRAASTYRRHVKSFIVLNQFAKNLFIEGGIPGERIFVKPNFCEDPGLGSTNHRSRGAFVGRLSAEKGINILSAACKAAGIQIDVVGSGPLENFVRSDPMLSYLGFMEREELRRFLSGASYLVVPSIWLETFGMVVIEAFSLGVPVIASRIGALAEIVCDGRNGILVSPSDERELATALAYATENPQAMLTMGAVARQDYLKKYTPDVNYSLLLNIYKATVERDDLCSEQVTMQKK